MSHLALESEIPLMGRQQFELVELDDQIEIIGQDFYGRTFELRWPRQLAVSTATHIFYWDAGDEYDRDWDRS